MPTPNRICVMSEPDVRRAVARMSREVVEKNGGTESKLYTVEVAANERSHVHRPCVRGAPR